MSRREKLASRCRSIPSLRLRVREEHRRFVWRWDQITVVERVDRQRIDRHFTEIRWFSLVECGTMHVHFHLTSDRADGTRRDGLIRHGRKGFPSLRRADRREESSSTRFRSIRGTDRRSSCQECGRGKKNQRSTSSPSRTLSFSLSADRRPAHIGVERKAKERTPRREIFLSSSSSSSSPSRSPFLALRFPSNNRSSTCCVSL